MYINNVVRHAISVIKNINNNENKFKNSLSGFILGCYNTVFLFIKPIFNKDINYIGLKKSISNIENKSRLNKDNNVCQNKSEGFNKLEMNDSGHKEFSRVSREVKSDEIKNNVINEIIKSLGENKNVREEDLLDLKAKLHLNTQKILFSGDKSSLNKSKEFFLKSITETILNSDEKIKSHIGNIDTYKFFLSDDISEIIHNVLYK